MTTHRIGDQYAAKYANAPVPKENQYPIGQRVYVLDKETKKRVAVFEVTETDDENIKGKIIVTYDAKTEGYFSKTISIYSNIEGGLTQLFIQGTVVK